MEADVVVLAGDIGLGFHGLEWAAKTFAEKPVIYVPGNHEFYGKAIPRFLDKMQLRSKELGVHLLCDSSVTINGVRFLGATLWTDLKRLETSPSLEELLKTQVNDYRRIRVTPAYRRLKPLDTQLWHGRSRRWLEGEIGDGLKEPSAIVTHHTPTLKSIAAGFLDNPLSIAYASELDELVLKSGARYWLHGHTHHNVDYMLGQTRIVANQRGYVPETTPGFDPRLILEI